MLNLVTLVNERDEVIGEMDKIEAHRGDGHLHRCVSVYLFRKKNNAIELLIQQRSSVKIVGANLWANTICGNVRPSENYEECAYRRLKEELGITKVKIEPFYKFQYHLPAGGLTKEAVETLRSSGYQATENEIFSEWEVDQVFIGWYDEEVNPNPEEAQDYEWVNFEELQKKEKGAVKNPEEFNTKEVLLNNKKMTLAPWFLWMLNDEKLMTLIRKGTNE